MCVQIGSIRSIFIVILKYEMLFCYTLFQANFVIFSKGFVLVLYFAFFFKFVERLETELR